MNILILSWRGPGHPHEGGAEQSTLEHAKYWIKKGANNVWWFTSEYENSRAREVHEGITVIRKGNQLLGVHIHALLWYLFGKHPRFDLVIDQIHGIPFFTPLYVRTKKLAFIHEVAKDVWLMNPLVWPLSHIFGYLGKFFEPVFFYFYKAIPFFTVSDSTKEDLVNFGVLEKNITVIHNGLSLPSKKSTSIKQEKTLMYLGALAKDKGIDDAISIFKLLWEKAKDYKFWVVGKGEHEYITDPPITYFGFVNEEKKYDLLSKATMLINPSIREGWGLVNIEAAYSGTPVIGYKVPGVKDSVLSGKTGLLVEKNDVAKMAKAVSTLVNDKKKYNKMSLEAKKWAQNFTWEKAGKESLKLIEGI